jgi:hypothetical protein
MCVILRKRIESKNLKFQIIPNPQSSQAKALPKSGFYSAPLTYPYFSNALTPRLEPTYKNL